MDGKPLTDRQEQYVRAMARGVPSREAARSCGYSQSYSEKISTRLAKHPAVKSAIDGIRKEARTAAVYGLVEAVKEIDRAILFGYKCGNPMSVAKLLDLKGRMYGLLVDRHEITIDLSKALSDARARLAHQG